jgi:ferredoxin
MRVTGDKDTCAVSSLCVYRAPQVFDQDEEGHVVVLRATPPPELHEEIRRAARGCPTRSIHIEDDVDAGLATDAE